MALNVHGFCKHCGEELFHYHECAGTRAEAAAAKQANRPLDKLETQTCSRCCGSGEYSYCQMYGRKCFKCAGAGKVYTARGAAALRYLNDLRSKPAAEVRQGDAVWREPVPGFCKGGWVIVTEIRTYDTSGCRSWVDGVEIPQRTDLLEIRGEKHAFCGVAPESLVRVRQTPTQVAETLAAALAYQATLTKAGTPRKRAA